MAIDDSHGYDLLDRLAEEFADRFRRGERPSLKEYVDRYPDLADDIREMLPALVKVGQAAEICQDRDEAEQARTAVPPLSQVGDYRIIREVGHGGMGVVYEAEQVSLGRRVAVKVLPWQPGRDGTSLERFRREARASARLHHTNIVPVFEVGRDGDVQYYAMQFIQGQSLDAVIDELRRLRGRSRRERGRGPTPRGRKETRPDDSGTRGHTEELGVAASLLSGRFDRGPTVVPAVGSSLAGQGGPVSSKPVLVKVPDPSAVMPGGADLSSVESRYRAFHRGVAHIGRQVAAALAHAHGRGILHRDVKPSNLLLDTEGVVWVSDFGLAKVDDDELTKTGDILGTLRYMAPERLRGRGDARADVYSLGLTLYELLVLRPAFDSPDRLALSEQIKSVDPPRPRSIDPRIPRDLETIVLKAIEKDPGDRYATADAMGEDLRRFLDDEPILARRASAPERYARWARRNPIIAALGGVLTAVLVVATLASVLAARRMAALAEVNEDAARSERRARVDAQLAQEQAESDRLEADRQRQEADRQRERGAQHLYIARIGQAEAALRLFDSTTARGLLDQCRPEPGGPDRRGWEWFYLDQWCQPELRALTLPTRSETNAVKVSPDGRFLAVGGGDPNSMNDGSFPPVPAYLINLPDGKVRHELAGHHEFVHAVAFRPDGEHLATLGKEGTIQVWSTRSGRKLKAIRLNTRSNPNSGRLSWSPNGQWLAVALDDAVVSIWDPETGRETSQIAHSARSVAWSPDSTRIAVGGRSGLEVHLWDAGKARPQRPVFRRAGDVSALRWSPDSRRLAAYSLDGDVSPPGWGLNVWDPTSGRRVSRVGPLAEAGPIAFSRDGSLLATSGADGLVQVFDAASGRERAAQLSGYTTVADLDFGADGRRLYVSGWGLTGIKVFDPDRSPRGRGHVGAVDQIGALTFDREGLRLREIGWQAGELVDTDPVDGTMWYGAISVTASRAWPRGDFVFSSDGSQVAAPTHRDRSIVGVWDLALGYPVASLRGSGGPVTAVAFRPDGRALATAANGGPNGGAIVTLWHLASGRAIRSIGAGPHPVRALGFSRDGRKLAAGGSTTRDGPGWVTAWDAETWAVLGTLDRVGLVMFLAFHPDGTRLAIADYGEAKVHVWDLAAGTVITDPGPRGISCVGFTPDGKRLATVGYDGNVHLADPRTGDEVIVLRGFGAPVGSIGFTPRVAFSPDGSRIAANYGIMGRLNVWDVGPNWNLSVEPEPGDVAGWLRRSRALVDQDDVAGAETAFTRACGINSGDASPWVEHALSLWHRGDSAWARNAWDRATRALPDDPSRWIDLGRLLERVGRAKESETALAKGRSLLERRLLRAPDDEGVAAALAGLLPDADSSLGWTILQPDTMTSAAGTTLTRLPDGSVLAGGLNPDVDTYTIEASTALSGITAMRLEAIPDPSLPWRGSGRDRGNFHLDSFRLCTFSERSAPVPVRLCRACADYSELMYNPRGVRGALDTDPATAWSIWPLVSRPHVALFQTARPIGTGAGLRLRVELASRSAFPRSTPGRFRLSVTNRPFSALRPRLLGIKADTEQNGLTRLGAAHALLGEWERAAAVLEQSAARPEASALDGFLLALARHHLGRVDVARRDCDRALERLGSRPSDEATRDVAVESLMVSRGLSIDEAESLLLDVGFPADSFAP